jgi:hypothetical protein
MITFRGESIATELGGSGLLMPDQQLRINAIEARSQRLSEARRRRINQRYARLAIRATDDCSALSLNQVIAAYGNMVDIALQVEQRSQRRQWPLFREYQLNRLLIALCMVLTFFLLLTWSWLN